MPDANHNAHDGIDWGRWHDLLDLRRERLPGGEQRGLTPSEDAECRRITRVIIAAKEAEKRNHV